MKLERIAVAVAAGCIGIGCATVRGEGKTEVDLAALSRVPDTQMGDVRAKEAELGRLREERAAQELALRTAKANKDAAGAEVSARKAEQDRSEAELKAAQATGDKTRVDEAQQRLEVAELGIEAARARQDLEQRNVDLAQARMTVVDQRIEVAQAELEQARLQALINANDAAARDYNAQELAARVAKERADMTEAERKVQESANQLADAERQWQMIHERWQTAMREHPVG